ncbi:MAG: hypothetical protein ABIQ73_21950 [Acidimicrobiales bacterium]
MRDALITIAADTTADRPTPTPSTYTRRREGVPTGPRRGITIFRAEQATPIVETDFMAMPSMTGEALAAGGPEIFMASAPGTDVRIAVRQTPEEGGFSILHVWFKADYPVPRARVVERIEKSAPQLP